MNSGEVRRRNNGYECNITSGLIEGFVKVINNGKLQRIRALEDYKIEFCRVNIEIYAKS